MGIFKKISAVFRSKNAQDIIDNLEDVLLEAGLSPQLTYEALDKLDQNAGGISDPKKIIELLKNILNKYTQEYELILTLEPRVFMFIGVNGVGKTTSIAKFIYFLQHIHGIASKDIVVAAGDTFRAGAIEQISKHCDVLGVTTIKQKAGADPAAVVYDTLQYARSHNIQYLIADTAGRMNNRVDLIAQLQKIYRLLQKDLDSSQITTFIILDGNSGLNTVSQVEDFKEAIPIDAAILSKYDGSSKGGSILSMYKKCGMPCAFLGIGEKYTDLKIFNKEEFLDEFLFH